MAHRHTAIVRRLINIGAGLDLQDNQGSTALILAARERYTEIAQALIHANANFDTQDNQGLTALMYASFHGHAIAQELLRVGANHNLRCNRGRTALMFASRSRRTAIIQVLLTRVGANHDFVNLRDNDGNTALMFAAINGRTEAVQILLRAGANHSLQNNNGRTALMHAISAGERETARHLRMQLPFWHQQRYDIYIAFCMVTGIADALYKYKYGHRHGDIRIEYALAGSVAIEVARYIYDKT